jgi:hypothetical protein
MSIPQSQKEYQVQKTKKAQEKKRIRGLGLLRSLLLKELPVCFRLSEEERTNHQKEHAQGNNAYHANHWIK